MKESKQKEMKITKIEIMVGRTFSDGSSVSLSGMNFCDFYLSSVLRWVKR